MYRFTYFFNLVVLFLFALVSAVPTSTPTSTYGSPTQSPSCPFPTAVQLRFPPTVRNNTPPDWTAPPYAWIYGNWWVTHSSRRSYQTFYNFQADTYPVFPQQTGAQRRNIDLTSWNVAKTGNASIDNHVYSVFGYDTPATNVGAGMYLFNGTGVLASLGNYWEIMAWGYDRNGNGYRAEFETASPNSGDEPCIDIVSRSEMGPDNATLSEIVAAMHRLFDGSSIGAYVANLTRLHDDGRRSNMGPFVCDASCMNNTNLPPR